MDRDDLIKRFELLTQQLSLGKQLPLYDIATYPEEIDALIGVRDASAEELLESAYRLHERGADYLTMLLLYKVSVIQHKAGEK